MTADTAPVGGEVPDVTVVVVNYNGGDYLRGCLASLAVQTHRNFEVIVVDNDSKDDSLSRIRETPERLTILRQDVNTGFAGGNNIGARAGKGRWLALLNPDAEAAPDWIESVLRALAARPAYRMLACLQIDLADTSRLDGAGDCYGAFGMAWRGGHGHPASAIPPAGECFAPCGASAVYPRELFVAAGGYDERYFCYHEDVDLGFRLRLMGERCQFDPACVVRHAGSAIAGRRSAFAIYHGARNGVWTYLKNMPPLLLAVTLPGFIAAHLPLFVRNIMKGGLAHQLRGLGDALRALPKVMADRRAVQRRRKVGSWGMARQLTWNPLRFVGRQIVVTPFRPSLTAAMEQTRTPA